MKIEILTSGSKGNSILFERSILLDTGIAFSQLKSRVDELIAVLLTHIHGDHFNPSTIRSIHIANERIKFCCGEFLADSLLAMGMPENNIITLEPGKNYSMNGINFSPVSLYHDTPNFGYRLMKDGHKHIHATDTVSMEGIFARNYDSATVEANHCLDAAQKIIKEKRDANEFCHLNRAIKTHLSVQKTVSFINSNKIKKYIPVHVGSSTSNQVYEYLKENLSADRYNGRFG